MPVPKRKRSRVRRDKRFANKGMEVKSFGGCKTCSAPLASHIVCQFCGHYKGVKVMHTKQERAEKRAVVLQAKTAAKNRRSSSHGSEQTSVEQSS